MTNLVKSLSNSQEATNKENKQNIIKDFLYFPHLCYNDNFCEQYLACHISHSQSKQLLSTKRKCATLKPIEDISKNSNLLNVHAFGVLPIEELFQSQDYYYIGKRVTKNIISLNEFLSGRKPDIIGLWELQGTIISTYKIALKDSNIDQFGQITPQNIWIDTSPKMEIFFTTIINLDKIFQINTKANPYQQEQKKFEEYEFPQFIPPESQEKKLIPFGSYSDSFCFGILLYYIFNEREFVCKISNYNDYVATIKSFSYLIYSNTRLTITMKSLIAKLVDQDFERRLSIKNITMQEWDWQRQQIKQELHLLELEKKNTKETKGISMKKKQPEILLVEERKINTSTSLSESKKIINSNKLKIGLLHKCLGSLSDKELKIVPMNILFVFMFLMHLICQKNTQQFVVEILEKIELMGNNDSVFETQTKSNDFLAIIKQQKIILQCTLNRITRHCNDIKGQLFNKISMKVINESGQSVKDLIEIITWMDDSNYNPARLSYLGYQQIFHIFKAYMDNVQISQGKNDLFLINLLIYFIKCQISPESTEDLESGSIYNMLKEKNTTDLETEARAKIGEFQKTFQFA